MTSEIPAVDYQQQGQKRLMRPKLLKLTDDSRNRKKSKFKVNKKSFF